MNTKQFAHDLELLCTAYKVPVDVGLKFGNAYTELISDKSGNDVRDAAKPRLREFYQEYPDAEVDDGELCVKLGLKNTNADKSWLRHQRGLLRITNKPLAEAAE